MSEQLEQDVIGKICHPVMRIFCIIKPKVWRRSPSIAPVCIMHSALKPLLRFRKHWSWPALDEEVGVIILTGAGEKAFCSGGDQSVRGDSGYKDDKGTHHLNVLDLQRQIRTCPKPVIAMVAGYAMAVVMYCTLSAI